MLLFQIYTGYYYKNLIIFTKNQVMKDERYGYIIDAGQGRKSTLFKGNHPSFFLCASWTRTLTAAH